MYKYENTKVAQNIAAKLAFFGIPESLIGGTGKDGEVTLKDRENVLNDIAYNIESLLKSVNVIINDTKNVWVPISTTQYDVPDGPFLRAQNPNGEADIEYFHMYPIQKIDDFISYNTKTLEFSGNNSGLYKILRDVMIHEEAKLLKSQPKKLVFNYKKAQNYHDTNYDSLSEDCIMAIQTIHQLLPINCIDSSRVEMSFEDFVEIVSDIVVDREYDYEEHFSFLVDHFGTK